MCVYYNLKRYQTDRVDITPHADTQVGVTRRIILQARKRTRHRLHSNTTRNVYNRKHPGAWKRCNNGRARATYALCRFTRDWAKSRTYISSFVIHSVIPTCGTSLPGTVNSRGRRTESNDRCSPRLILRAYTGFGKTLVPVRNGCPAKPVLSSALVTVIFSNSNTFKVIKFTLLVAVRQGITCSSISFHSRRPELCFRSASINALSERQQSPVTVTTGNVCRLWPSHTPWVRLRRESPFDVKERDALCYAKRLLIARALLDSTRHRTRSLTAPQHGVFAQYIVSVCSRLVRRQTLIFTEQHTR